MPLCWDNWGPGFRATTVGSTKRYLSIHGGFVEVLPDQVRVLANVAERAEEIDIERARKDLQTAQEQVMNPALGVDPAIAATLEAQWRPRTRRIGCAPAGCGKAISARR